MFAPLSSSTEFRMRIVTSLVLTAVIGLAGRAAHAQDETEDPTHGTATLEAGFSQETAQFQVVAQGELPADDDACTGFFESAPTFVVHYSGPNPLRIDVVAEDGVSLLVKAENTVGECDDNGGETAYVVVRDSGVSSLKIWVGVVAPDISVAATLSFSEVAGDQWAPVELSP
jgi:hypothetical protein